jgi:hypothetical protein
MEIYGKSDGADMRGAWYIRMISDANSEYIDAERFCEWMFFTGWYTWFTIADDTDRVWHNSDYEILEFLPMKDGRLTRYSCMPGSTDKNRLHKFNFRFWRNGGYIAAGGQLIKGDERNTLLIYSGVYVSAWRTLWQDKAVDLRDASRIRAVLDRRVAYRALLRKREWIFTQYDGDYNWKAHVLKQFQLGSSETRMPDEAQWSNSDQLIEVLASHEDFNDLRVEDGLRARAERYQWFDGPLVDDVIKRPTLYSVKRRNQADQGKFWTQKQEQLWETQLQEMRRTRALWSREFLREQGTESEGVDCDQIMADYVNKGCAG